MYDLKTILDFGNWREVDSPTGYFVPPITEEQLTCRIFHVSPTNKDARYCKDVDGVNEDLESLVLNKSKLTHVLFVQCTQTIFRLPVFVANLKTSQDIFFAILDGTSFQTQIFGF